MACKAVENVVLIMTPEFFIKDMSSLLNSNICFRREILKFAEIKDCKLEIHFSAFFAKSGSSEENSIICIPATKSKEEISAKVNKMAMKMARALGNPLASIHLLAGNNNKDKTSANESKINRSCNT